MKEKERWRRIFCDNAIPKLVLIIIDYACLMTAATWILELLEDLAGHDSNDEYGYALDVEEHRPHV